MYVTMTVLGETSRQMVTGMGCAQAHWACREAPTAAVEVREVFPEERALSRAFKVGSVESSELVG